MRQRCTNPNVSCFKHYGGKGVSVHSTWNKFWAFVEGVESEIGPRPTSKHTLDRIDGNGNYEPGNVQWATQAMQIRNQARNQNAKHFYDFEGKTQTLTDWAMEKSMAVHTLRARLKTFNWPIEKALTTPVRNYR